MTFRLAAAVAGAFLITGPAAADEVALAKAVSIYNSLPSKARVLVVEVDGQEGAAATTRLPAWLNKAGLDGREAAAVVAAFGVYGSGYATNFRTRRWSDGAKIAGTVADVALNSNPQRLPDAMPNEPPARALADGRRVALLAAMRDLGTCSGALVRAVRKTGALRPDDDASRLLVKAKRDLGTAVFPPDDSCLS